MLLLLSVQACCGVLLPLQERASYAEPASCRVLERSVFSDSLVFVRAMATSGDMNDTHLAIYKSWFKTIVEVSSPDNPALNSKGCRLCKNRE